MYKKRGYIPIASNDDQDLMARVCNLNIRVKFDREGAYKYEQKKLSEWEDSCVTIVYPSKRIVNASNY